MIEIPGRKCGRAGHIHAEKIRIIGGQAGHVIAHGIKHVFFLLKNKTKKAGLVMVHFHAARRPAAPGSGSINQFPGGFGVKIAPGTHAGDNSRPAHCNIAVFVGKKQLGAYSLIAAPCRVGAVNAGQNGKPHLCELGMTE